MQLLSENFLGHADSEVLVLLVEHIPGARADIRAERRERVPLLPQEELLPLQEASQSAQDQVDEDIAARARQAAGGRPGAHIRAARGRAHDIQPERGAGGRGRDPEDPRAEAEARGHVREGADTGGEGGAEGARSGVHQEERASAGRGGSGCCEEGEGGCLRAQLRVAVFMRCCVYAVVNS